MSPGRGQYDHEKWARAQIREEERLARAEAAAQKAAEREQRVQQVEAGRFEAARRNIDLKQSVARLGSILDRGFDRPSAVDLHGLIRRPRPPRLDLGDRAAAAPRPSWDEFAPSEPGPVASMFGGRGRYERRLAEVREEFEEAERDHAAAEAARREWVRKQWASHEAAVTAHREEVTRHNRGIEEAIAGLQDRSPGAVQSYLELVLSRTPLPVELPRTVEIAYTPRGEQAVVRFELAALDVVPTVASFTYVGTTDTFREKARPKAEVAQLYRSVVSQITLLYLRDLLEADPVLENVELSGHVHATNPATGQREYPCLISVAVDRAAYDKLNLRSVTPERCLHHLNALVSHHPHLVEPVTPVRDFDLARYSFVEGVDVVAGLDSRPDLTAMTPTEFEHFVRQLFEARGLEGWTTERTGDDGVDAVVINRDPMVGGLTIVQAKKYTRVLGVNHIRELVGAMDEKRAGRGILVTTSWFASGGWTKATENGRVELIDGPRLRHLVQEHLHKDVLVAPPAGRARTWTPPSRGT